MPHTAPFIHLYFLPVFARGYDTDLVEALALLDRQEKQRYESFRLEKSKQSFLQTRRIIKSVLVHYGVTPPVQFHYSERGKPSVSAAVHFSLAHCRDGIAVAVSSAPIGIDVESLDRGREVWRKADKLINSAALQAVNQQATDVQSADMFTFYWTCIEALVKLNDSSIYRERDTFSPPAPELSAAWQTMTWADKRVWSASCGGRVRVSLVTELPHAAQVFAWQGRMPAREIIELEDAL